MTDLTVTSLSRTVDALQREVDRLRRAAHYDALTGLGNRRLLEERTHAREGYFVAIDLDGFKAAQDAHRDGHAFGDEVLRRFASFLLRTAGGDNRVACRVGGDEFTVWCPTWSAARVIRNRVSDWTWGGITASAGIGVTRETADRAAYRAKRARRDS